MPKDQDPNEQVMDDDELLQVLEAEQPALVAGSSTLSAQSGKSSKTEKSERNADRIVEKVEETQIAKENTEILGEKESDEQEKKKETIFERGRVYENSRWWQKLFHTWAFDIISASKQRKLTTEDFGGIKMEDTVDKRVASITDLYDKQPAGEKNIMWALAQTFKWEFATFYGVEAFLSCLRLQEPLAVQKMVTILQAENGDPWEGMRVLLFMIACQMTESVIGHQIHFRNCDLGHTAYRAMNSVVYNKQLRLSAATSKNFSHGEVNHYAQGAVGMIIHMCFDAVNVCRLPLYFVYCVYSLVGLLGFNLLTAVFLMIFQMYFGHWVHNRNHKQHQKLGRVSSRRRKYMSETVYNSKTLKFYNWTEPFAKEIRRWRSKEMKIRWDIHLSGIGSHIVSSFLPRIMNPLIFASFFYFGGTLDLAKSMQLTHMLGMLNGQLHHFPHIQRMWAHLRVQLKLLQRYLDSPEVEEGLIIQQDKRGDELDEDNEYAIRINNHSFSWGIRTRNELEEELERRKLARDERRSAWMLTQAFNKAGKATDKAIKALTAKPKAMKTQCRCEVQCFKYSCRCATNCLLVKQYNTKEKLAAQAKKDEELAKQLKEEKEAKAKELKLAEAKEATVVAEKEESQPKEGEEAPAAEPVAEATSESAEKAKEDKPADEKKEEKDEMKCRCKVQCFKQRCRCATACRLVTLESEHATTLDDLVSLKDIDLHIKKGEFTCIIGECGSGKSTLLSTIIGDLLYVDPAIMSKYGSSVSGLNYRFKSKSAEGRAELRQVASELVDGVGNLFKPPIRLNGSLAYAQQTPWIQNMTIRDNILYGEEMDQGHYYDTIKLCELERDFEILPAGDLTEIGERGINLSGGQKARIGLARAVYSRKDIYLMDDPISALDAEVRKNIFKNVIFGHLKDKTCVLVTHAIDFLSYAHKVVVMEKGRIITQGTYDEVKEHKVVKKLLEVNDLNKNKVTEKKMKLNKEGSMVECEASDQDYDSSSEAEVEQKEEPVDAKADDKVSEQEADVTMIPSYTAQDLTEQEKVEKFNKLGKKTNKNDGKIIRDDDDEDVKVGLETYKQLVVLFGGMKYLILACFVSAFLCYCRIKTDYVIAQWGNDVELQKTKYGQFILVVSAFALSSLVSEAVKSVLMMILNMRAATDMHDAMIQRIVRAPQNLFFDTHSNASVMKRLSEDLGTLEHHMAEAFVEVVQSLQTMVSVTWIIYQANWRLLLAFPVMAAVSCTLYMIMMPAHKSICSLLGQTDKPIGNLRNESIQGNSTIRAFKKEKLFMNLNSQLLDSDILVHRTSMAIWMWFGNSNCFNVQALSFISCTIMLFHGSADSTDAIWKSMVLQRIWDLHGSLWGLLHQTSDIERRMVKVLKCFQTLEIPQERSDAKTVLTEEQLKSWPSTGSLIYDDVHLRYRPDCDLVLKGVSFDIKGGEKVGIVGRTGAGKSTLIQCISRLVEIESGNMIIDGVNTSDLPLEQVRDAITVIPQDPTLFAGSVRFNLDPMEKHTDEEMLSLLERAGLQKILNREKTSAEDQRGKRSKKRVYDDSDSQSQSSSSESEEEEDADLKKEKSSSPLDMAIQEGGDNLSSGEKQLLCICRAALRKRKIIVLDEATANIDLITEQKIQKFMAAEFKDQTMLVIAHRLQTIIESDKVMVLGDGKVIEFDSPDALMENEKSHFTKLVKQLKKKATAKEDAASKKEKSEEKVQEKEE